MSALTRYPLYRKLPYLSAEELRNKGTTNIASIIRNISVFNDQILPCIQEPENPEDKNTVALMSKELIFGHVPKNISVWMAIFLKLSNSSIASRVTGEKVNRGGGYGLEIPCKYLVEGETRTVDWLLQKVEKEKELCKNLVAVNQERKCVKERSHRH